MLNIVIKLIGYFSTFFLLLFQVLKAHKKANHPIKPTKKKRKKENKKKTKNNYITTSMWKEEPSSSAAAAAVLHFYHPVSFARFVWLNQQKQQKRSEYFLFKIENLRKSFKNRARKNTNLKTFSFPVFKAREREGGKPHSPYGTTAENHVFVHLKRSVSLHYTPRRGDISREKRT